MAIAKWKVSAAVIAWTAGVVLCARTDATAVQLYVTVTLFVAIARNLGHRRDGLSAYSVFNRGFTPLLGQLQPHQFDNEIRHRPIETEPQQHSAASSTAPSPQHDSLLESLRAEIQLDARRARRTAETNTDLRQPLRARGRRR